MNGNRLSLRLWLPGICFLLAFFLYFPTVTYDFLWDDTQFILQNPYLRNPAHLWDVFARFFSFDPGSARIVGAARPAWLASLIWDYWIWQLNPAGYHLTNILLHALNSGLAFFVAMKLLRNPRAAVIAAIAFALHPVHAESVAAIGFRTDLLCLFFIQLACLSFWKACPFEDDSRSRTGRAVFYSLSLALYLLALLSKEASAPLPAALLLGDILLRRKPIPFPATSVLRPWLKRALLYLPFALVFGFYWHQHEGRFLYKLSESPVAQLPSGTQDWKSNVDTRRKAELARNLGTNDLLLDSFGALPADASVPDSRSGREEQHPTAWVRSGFATTLNAAELETQGTTVNPPAPAPNTPISTAYHDPLSKVATMSPVFARYIGKMFFPLSYSADYDVAVRNSFSEPAVFLSVFLIIISIILFFWTAFSKPLIGWGIGWFGLFLLPATNLIPLANLMADRYLYVPSLGLLVAGGAATEILFRKTASAKTMRRLMLSAAVVLLTAWAGKSLLYSRIWQDDLALFTEIVEQSPRGFRGWYNLALAYQRRGLWQKAIANYRQAAERGPHRKEIYVNMGKCYERDGDAASAENAYREALRWDPKDRLALSNLGLLYHRQKREEAAIDYLTRALRASNEWGLGAFYLANVYFDTKNFRSASHYYRMAVDWNPVLAIAHYRLGLSFFLQNKRAIAEKIWKQHLLRYPNDIQGRAAIERHLAPAK